MAFSMKTSELSMDNTPIYQVDTEKGVMGQALNNGSILIDKHLSGRDKEEVIKHEKVHLDQMSRGDLDYDGDNVYWKGKKYPRSVMNEGAKNLPWEKEAYNKNTDMKNSTKNTPFYKTGPLHLHSEDHKDPKEPSAEKKHHPGYKPPTLTSYSDKSIEAQYANQANKRDFKKSAPEHKKKDLNTPFPGKGQKLGDYKVASIEGKTGDYFVRKDENPKMYRVSRRDVKKLVNTKNATYQANFRPVKHGYDKQGNIYER